MRPRLLMICALALVLSLVAGSAAAKKKPITIEVITTFDYPGVGNSTTPFGINDERVIAGDFTDSSGARRGFVRFADGTFSDPIVHPDDKGNFTRGTGINNAQTIVGDFLEADINTFHGYLLGDGVFTQFDIGGPFSTALFGINDAENLAGVFGSSVQPNQAFVNIGGVSTVISIPGAATSFANGINNFDQVVGQYSDSGGNFHGFFRDADGTLTFPIDFPGAASTRAFGINDRGWIVGRYDSGGQAHGFFLLMPDTFVSFDFPGAAQTSLNGINKAGFIAGRYTDSSGVRHGFIARVKRVPKS